MDSVNAPQQAPVPWYDQPATPHHKTQFKKALINFCVDHEASDGFLKEVEAKQFYDVIQYVANQIPIWKDVTARLFFAEGVKH